MLPYIARWLASLPWAPWQGIAELINEWHNTWTGVALIVIGAIAGLVFAFAILDDMVKITMNRDALTFEQKETKTVFPRTDVSGIFFDGKELVLVSSNLAEIHRLVPEDISRHDLIQTLGGYGWPFREDDPFATDLTPWVPHTRRLPEEANALLETRAEALTADDRDRANALSRKLGTMGYVVRDRDEQQHVAPVNAAND